MVLSRKHLVYINSIWLVSLLQCYLRWWRIVCFHPSMVINDHWLINGPPGYKKAIRNSFKFLISPDLDLDFQYAQNSYVCITFVTCRPIYCSLIVVHFPKWPVYQCQYPCPSTQCLFYAEHKFFSTSGTLYCHFHSVASNTSAVYWVDNAFLALLFGSIYKAREWWETNKPSGPIGIAITTVSKDVSVP